MDKKQLAKLARAEHEERDERRRLRRRQRQGQANQRENTAPPHSLRGKRRLAAKLHLPPGAPAR